MTVVGYGFSICQISSLLSVMMTVVLLYFFVFLKCDLDNNNSFFFPGLLQTKRSKVEKDSMFQMLLFTCHVLMSHVSCYHVWKQTVMTEKWLPFLFEWILFKCTTSLDTA